MSKMTTIIFATQIHIVEASGGEYSDRWVSPLMAFPDKEKAEAYIKELVVRDLLIISQKKEVANWELDWLEKNPRPQYVEPILEKISKWKNIKNITPEMRKDRADKLDLWYNKLEQAKEEFCTSKGYDLEAIEKHDSDVSYSTRTVDFRN